MFIEKQQLQRLFIDEDLSKEEIARKLQTTVSNVMYHIGKHGLRKQSKKMRQQDKGQSTFTIPKQFTPEQTLLHNIGLAFFVSNDKSKQHVIAEHRDKTLLAVFVRVLKDIYKVDAGNIRVKLVVYTTDNPQIIRDQWASSLDLPVSSFDSPEIINPDPAQIHIEDRDHLCTIQVCDNNLLRHLQSQVQQYLQQVGQYLENA